MIILNKTHLYIFHQQDKLRDATNPCSWNVNRNQVKSRILSWLPWPWRPGRLGSYDRTVVGWCTAWGVLLSRLQEGPAQLEHLALHDTIRLHGWNRRLIDTQMYVNMYVKALKYHDTVISVMLFSILFTSQENVVRDAAEIHWKNCFFRCWLYKIL